MAVIILGGGLAGLSLAHFLNAWSIVLGKENTPGGLCRSLDEAPLKLMFPLVLFIFPTIFIIIFGPIVLSFMKSGGF